MPKLVADSEVEEVVYAADASVATDDVFVLPASRAQRRLWFLDRLDPGGAVYNVPLAFRLDGPLDRAALARALRALAERHEVLRTTFSVEGEEPVQVVAERARAALPWVDLEGLSGAAAEAEADRLTRAAALRPFDLAAGPLLRARLLRLPSPDPSAKRAERHRFLLEIHHAVCDGWSLGVLRRELAALYRDPDADLPELPIQYGDYAAWQEEWLESDERDRQLDWWRERLDGMPEVMDLPFAGPRPAVRDRRGGRRSRTVPEPLAASLDALARQAGATRFMVYLAAWKLLLHRLAPEIGRAGDGDDRRPDATVGVPVAGRSLEETEGLIGLFVNTLVLRTRLADGFPGGPAPSFREIVGRVKDGMLAALSHQDLPFESLVEELVPERDLSYEPLVQVTFGLEEGGGAGSDPFGLPGVHAEALPTDHDRMKVDLALLIEEVAQERGGWRSTLSYTADLFRPADAERLLRCYETLLAAVATDPERPVSELPVMDAGERHRVLYEWADGGAAPSAEIAPEGSAATIHGLVEASAERAPERVAVVGSHEEGGGGTTLSYREVIARARRLADDLRALGVAPGDRVGVSLPRSPRLIPALLGVLRAGAAYVPLDPEYPEERLAFTVDDAEIRLLVTEPGTAERLAGMVADRGLRLLLLSESGEPTGSTEPAGRARAGAAEVSPDALAYLIYTSGSTGRPKGVAIPHRSAVAMILWAGGLYGPSGRDDFAGLFAATSMSFDLSVFELFAPLAVGGRVTIGADVLALFGSATAADARGSVRLLNTVPSAIAELVRGAAVPDSVRAVNLAGEPLKRDLVDRIYACPGVEAVYNLYGPSEDTTYSTFERVPRDAPEEPAIGRPLAGTRALVLDRDLRPVPAGVAGELFLAGAGVARGYLGRPEATAESFLPDPFTAGAGGRMYRTGDRVIHLPDGRLAFRGRLDRQVKLRGFRIELGEIETALAAHPDVAEAAVLFRRGDDAAGGDRSDRLVAYYEPPKGTEAPSPQALAAHLAERLPAYMIPGAWAALDALPLTPNGKIDRKALAAIEASSGEGGEPGAERTRPRTREERIVAEVWAELLGLDEVSAQDDFFAVGGHSLLATRMTGRLRQRTGLELPLRRVFERRTVAGIAAALAELGAALREDEREGRPAVPPLRPMPLDHDAPPPASFAQERLWFLDRLGDPDAAYNLPIPQRLSGPLDPAALAAALAGVARRHEVLRTVFRPAAELDEAAAVQVVRPPAPWHPLPVIDLGALAAPVREAELARLAHEEAGRPFDLAADPMMRTLLVRLDGRQRDDHALLLTLHHIAGDGWSASVLFRELAALYGGAAPDRPSADLPELPVRYADFALWQRRSLSGETLERELGFWRRQLAGAPPVLPLPTDRPRSAERTHPAATVSWQLSRRTTDDLRTLARERGASLFVALLAGFQALLLRTTGATDLPVGTPVANRTRPEIENLIGFFVNTLVLRSDLSGDPTFGELVERVREVAMEAFAHQDLPFEKLVQELSPERSLSHAPLVQVVLSLQNVPPVGGELPPAPSATEGGSVRREHLPLPSRSAKLDLTVAAHEVEEGPVGLDGQAELDRELFDPTTVRRLLRAFGHLLEAAAEDPGRRLSELPLVAGAERHQLLHEWNDTRSDYPPEAIGALLAKAALATPDAVATTFAGTFSRARGPARGRARARALTYGELGRRGDRLARRLAALGAGPDVPVGIAIERSVEMLVGLAGIVTSGAAYLPLDPDYPEERLRWMLEDTGAPIVVTAGAVSPGLETILARLEAETGVARIDLLDPSETAAGGTPAPAPLPAGGAGPENVACILYTSGSTGRPKGVSVLHRGIARMVFDVDYGDLGPERRVGLASTLAFDAATFEIWGALLRGATLVGLRREVVLDSERLAGELVRRRVSHQFLTTALFHQLVRSAEEDQGSARAALAGLDELSFGGEGCDPERVRQAAAALAGSTAAGVPGGLDRLTNFYGPCENTTFATYHRVREVPPEATTVPIGRPIASTTVYVTDGGLAPVPAGIAGELMVGGDGLARGYHRRPGLTAERFVPDPFSPRPGGRLYRTGDRVRLGATGRAEFLGRLDHQVKIRGFRIELGEIESRLARHPAVAAGVVVAREDAPGARRLVAYAVLGEESAGEDAAEVAAALRQHLAGSLPDFMVPAAVVILSELPLDPNGKVDRRALPAPEEIPPSAGTAAFGRPLYAPPRGPFEELVAEVWGELLSVADVGRHDDFFSLGGHSLLATRMTGRLRRRTGIDLPLRTLFEKRTVAGVAAALETLRREAIGAGADAPSEPPPLVSMAPAAAEGPLPASFAQERLWFLDRLVDDDSAYNLPLPRRLSGPLDPPALAAALAGVARRHEALRTVLRPTAAGRTRELHGAGAVQVVHPPVAVHPLPVVDLGALPEAAREATLRRLAREEARRPFDLANGPVMRATLIRMGGIRMDGAARDDHALLLTLHHTAGDGWSAGILFRELAALYGGADPADPSGLPALPIRYADFALWQRRWLSGETLERELDFWRLRLAGAPALLPLPTDRPRPEDRTAPAATLDWRLSREATEGLRAIARERGASLFVTLLAGFQALLARITDSTDLPVTTPVANRTRPETEGLIGFFVNTLVLRTDLAGDPSFDELVERARDVTLEAFAHQDLPFEKLVQEIRPARRGSHIPLAQVMLALQNVPDTRADLPGRPRAEGSDGSEPVRMEPILVGSPSAKLDLMVTAREMDGGLSGQAELDRELFDPETVEGLLHAYVLLLEAAATHPERRLSELLRLADAASGGELERILQGLDERRRARSAEEPAATLADGAGGAGEPEEPEEPAVRAPRGEQEELVAAVWTDLLPVTEVGAHEDFFALGGHSLLATRVIIHLRERTGIELPVKQLFKTPTVAALAAELARRQERDDGVEAVFPVIADEAGRYPPASFAQERLWFLARLGEDDGTYNLPTALDLAGPLDPAALTRALAALVAHHDALRTVLVPGSAAEGAFQRVLPASAVAASARPAHIDLSALPEDRRHLEARRAGRALAAEPFDLERGPLFRFALLHEAPERHLLAVVFHHAVADGWSLGVFYRDLAAILAGERLPEPGMRYADWAVRQRERLDGEVGRIELDHWRSALDGLPPLLDLPTDRPRPAVRSPRGGRVPVRLSGDRVDGLRDLARAHGASLFMACLATFQALLGRLAGADDLAVGTPIAGRTRAETEDLIGLFVNTLVLRGDLSGDPSFGELLERTRERALDAYGHQELPFERLVEALRPERSLDHTPLFQVMLTLQNAFEGELALPGLDAERVEIGAENAKFDLRLGLAERRGGLVGSVDFRRDLFDETTVRRWVRQLGTLIDAALASPGTPISALPLLPPAERHAVLHEAAVSASAPSGAPRPLYEPVAEWAREAPDAVAVEAASGHHLSYAALSGRAERLARRLATAGAGPDRPVALFLDRSPELVVAFLAAARAAAPAVPLDPDYPEERIAFALADSAAPVVVTTEALAPRLPETEATILDPGAGADPAESRSLPHPSLALTAPAYVLYTSGSTGRPNGVAVPQAAVAEHLRAMTGALPLTPGDAVLYKTPASFDPSVWELWAPLAAGARLVVARPGGHREPAYLAAAVERHRATVLRLVPTLFEALLDGTDFGDRAASLRRLFVGGEAFPRAAAARFLSGLPEDREPPEVINSYGPTEATVTSTWQRVRGDEGDGAMPIGRPVGHLWARVLDRGLRPAPLGAAGELVLSGPTLATGYHRRPVLTAERFVPDPYGDAPGARAYRSGDLTRLAPDGRLRFLGRLDGQVKLRGMRVELGEIEALLAEHPAVERAAARLVDGNLVAYAVLAPAAREGEGEDPEVSGTDLRDALAGRLPAALVPAAVVLLPELPLLPNGKVDRRALPAPEDVDSPGKRAGEPPRGPAEELVAQTWSELLELGDELRVGRRDDFFELGGHSLLATRVTARLRERTGVELPLRALFEERTVAGVALALERALERAEETRGTVTEAAEPPPLLPATADGPLPASFAQERLWFLDRMGDDPAVYNLPLSRRLSGPLDPAALAVALAGVVRRQDVLRTVLLPADELETEAAAVQVVRPAPAVHPLPVVDLGGLPEPLREASLRRLATDETRRPFDLATGPVLRATLIRMRARSSGTDDHALLATLHHSAGDGWSTGILYRELAALYGDPDTADLPELPIRYADYALWQRRWLSGETLEAELDFWRRRLEGAPPVLPLPTDRPRPAVRTARGEAVGWQLSRPATDGLRTVARERNASLFVALFAAFQALLHRVTGATDLPVGAPVANRNRPEIENLVGFFVNTLVLRSDLSGDPTFGELVERVREVALEAFAHQDLPFDKLVQEIHPERSLSHTPLVQVVLALQNVPGGRTDLPGREGGIDPVGTVRIDPVDLDWRTAKFDLTVAAREVDGDGPIGLRGQTELDLALFDRTTVRRWMRAFTHLLEAAAENPGRRLSELPLVTGAERHQLLHEWNDTRSDYPREPLGTLLAAAIEATPDAVAAVFPEAGGDGRLRTLTYAALGRRGARLAARLAAHGAGPDVPVGIAVERSVEMLVALAGIVATGAAYVPLDPDYPQERLRLMLEDTGAPIVVTAGPVSPGLEAVLAGNGAGTGAARIDLLETDPETGETPPEAVFPAADVSPESLAYVTYTSGSTGRPKGVAVPQSAVARLVFQSHFAEFGPERRVGQASTLAFDAATFEVWGALLHGATLVGLDRDAVLDAERLAGELVRRRVTTLFLTTALFNQLVQSAEELHGSAGPVLSGLDDLLFGGEACDPERVREAAAAQDTPAGSAAGRLRHVYGPTESTTFATCQRVREVPRGAATVSIGRPIASTTLHVTDRGLRPVPAGVGGELVLGGDGLARGYWNRPAVTAERFVPNPFPPSSPQSPSHPQGGKGTPPPDPLPAGWGARLYRTGDLVRRDAAGRIDFQGRFDHQVKIRGFRIELGEIESRLAQHPAVAAQVVVAREEVPGSQRLVAYAVPEEEMATSLDAAALRAYLAESLPEFMVPSAVVLLDELPLDPNGKVDRKALPAPEETGGAGDVFVPPRGPLEEIVAEVWNELLPVTRVGAHDSFFDLGGHSLLATRVVSRLRRLTGVELPLRSLFENPTVAGLARCLEGESGETRRAEGAEKAPPLEPRSGEDRQRETPASFAQERLWFLSRYGADRSQYNVPSPVRIDGPLVPAHLARGLSEIVRRHEALRTVFARSVREATGVVQRVLAAGSVPLPVIDLAGLPPARREAESRRLAAADAGRSFDLAVGPLLRTGLVRLAEEDHLLLFCQHHIVTDGWSLAILFRELETLYGALREGRRPQLPDLDVQYGDYALWQRRWLSGETLERQVSYWRERLAGVPAVLDLPTDRPRPPVQTLRGGELRVHLPAGLRDAVRALARRHGVSLFMTLLAGLQAVLGRLSGAAEVPVGAPIAGRTHTETEDLIGFFVNTLVFRGELAGDPGFDELLARTRDGALDAYAHQELPFEKLVEELRPERNLAHSPIFQVMFALQNTPPPVLSLPGARSVRPYEAGGYRAAKFDLTLGLVETAQGALAGDLSYNRDLFDATTVRRLMAHLATLLAAAAASPERRLSDLPLLGDGERHHLLREWNDTALAPPESPAERTLHGRIALQAAEAPDRVALVAGGAAGGGTLTYGELDARAERLARTLAARGVGAGVLVGIHLGRRPEMAVAVLAVEKAGGAYVPLETTWPLDRIGWITEEHGIRHLVTESSRLEAVTGLPDRRAEAGEPRFVIAADAQPEDTPAAPLPGEPGGPPPVDPEDPAYVIFTSGSTGRPKGVLVHHRPAAGLVSWVNRTFGVGPDDRLLFVTALSFDLSVYDLFGILSAGGTVRLATSGELDDPVRQVERMVADRITFWDSAPAALQRLAPLFPGAAPPASAVPASSPALRLVFLSGDWVPLALPDRVRDGFPGARVIALGGATEATVWSNYFPVGEVPPDWPSIPYGRPISNARYHVLGPTLRPCPVGAAGDLFIAGGCLSSGYVDDPRQTAWSYLPDPFADRSPGDASGAVLYRTGDRARYLPDGNLEFLGRLDSQVKVRGFRIELGEIESVLGEHPAVADAVALAREDVPGDQRLVAYLIPADPEAGPPTPEELRTWALRKLPEYMIPTAWVFRDEWPLSPTGKLDRKALPAPGAAEPGDGDETGAQAPITPARNPVERAVAEVWRDVLGVAAVGRDQNFFDLGGHSLLLARVQERLEERLGREIPMVELFRHPTVASVAAALAEVGTGTDTQTEPADPAGRRDGSGAVAVVGMAGRFPGARDVDELWRNLRAGVESIRFFDDEELEAAGYDPAALRDPALVKARGALDDPDLFDARFFGYSPREAEILDPQHRLFLEASWQALEDAGRGAAARGHGHRVGVFGGMTESTYQRLVRSDETLARAVGGHQIAISGNPDYLASRVSYKLGLTGPSVAVQTACSTSLVAVHMACRSLLEGACDLALAGGVSVQAREVSPYRWAEGGIGSPDGHVRAFDAEAGGVVGGSGVGVVVLRRLEDAVAGGDTIRAVIRGSAINNDGALKAGFTAPSAEGQAEVIREALEAAGVDPRTVGYVEAHGTATRLGDPIEISGLARAFTDGSERAGAIEKSCALGSVKTNLGHLDAAAGVTGLIKAVLALQHGEIPPSLHYRSPNPEIDFASTPFYVADRLIPFERNGAPRRAGVSAFGIGGTNAHAVLEEAPRQDEAPDDESAAGTAAERGAELLVLSAKSPEAADRAVDQLAEHLERRAKDSSGTCPPPELADVAWTLQTGRAAFPHRRAVVASPPEIGPALAEAARALRERDRRGSSSAAAPETSPPMVFLFPGQGAQFPDMGESLYREEPLFREAIDHAAEVLEPEIGRDLRELLFPEDPTSPRAEDALAATEITQPALFAVEHALMLLWESWGVTPAATLGHSLGEYTAAVRAGVFELDDALRLVAARGRLMASRPGGAMLGVRLGREELEAEMAEMAVDEMALAAVNGVDSCVVSGPAEPVAELRERLEARNVGCKPLHTSHAFHSPLMEPVVGAFEELVARVGPRAPELPFVSNVTGTWITADEAQDPGYWARHLRRPVLFDDGLATLLGHFEDGNEPFLLEVGPGRTLSNLARRHRLAERGLGFQPSLRRPRQMGCDRERVLTALGALWTAGVEIDWAGHHAGARRRRVPLPTYPFERRSFWVGADGAGKRREAEPTDAAEPTARPETTETPELSGVRGEVAVAFRELLGVEPAAEEDFFDLGGSSLMAVQLGARLREISGVELPSDFLLQAATPAALAELIESRRAAAESGEAPAASCLVPLRKSGSRTPLFLVHQVGGNVFSYRALAKELPAAQPIYALRSPGLEPGEETLGSVEEMAERYLELVRETQPRGPYRIGGASMGGMIAFDMAHRLSDAGETVELLTLMDSPCGDQMPPKPETDYDITAGVYMGPGRLAPEEVEGMDAEEQLRYAVEKAREAGPQTGTDFEQSFDRELEQLRRLAAVLRANIEALFAYQPEPWDGRAIFFRAGEKRPGEPPRPERPWIELARGGIEIHVVPGNHTTMHEPPNVETLARRLDRALGRSPTDDR